MRGAATHEYAVRVVSTPQAVRTLRAPFQRPPSKQSPTAEIQFLAKLLPNPTCFEGLNWTTGSQEDSKMTSCAKGRTSLQTHFAPRPIVVATNPDRTSYDGQCFKVIHSRTHCGTGSSQNCVSHMLYSNANTTINASVKSTGTSANLGGFSSS